MSDFPLVMAIFASGGGSNALSIAYAIESGQIHASIGLCVTNKPNAGVIDRLHPFGVPTLVLDPKSFDSEEAYTAELYAELDKRGVNFVVLAGYLQRIPAPVVRKFKGRILNIHPALLPAFGGKGYYGRRVHVAVLEHGVKWTGVTVHLVDEEYDTGPIVMQEPVRVEPDDTPGTLAARVLEVEHSLYPKAIAAFADGRVRVEGRKVVIAQE